jgi:hypothetical protein
MNAPSVAKGVNFINFSWPELKLRIMAEHVKDNGQAELSFFLMKDSKELLLHRTRVDLLSTSAVYGLIKRLEKNDRDISWEDVLTHITQITTEMARKGEPAQEIWAAEGDTLAPSYLLEPILYLNHPTVIFGDYGSLKSAFALVTVYIVQLPFKDNKLGLITNGESSRVLYLDYEDDPSSFRKRWSALERGFNTPPMPILYRRMTATLADSTDQLRRIIDDNGIKLLIVDSLGPAARGNLNDTEPAIKYHAALRQLGITSLTLAHTSKDQLSKKRTIFGSVFFMNLARSVWECKADQEIGEDEAIISLKHSKGNLSKLQPPLGYRFAFTNNSITVVKTDLGDTALSGELPLTWQIKNLLKQGSFTVKEISGRLDRGEDTIGRTLRRLRTKGQAAKLEGDTWGLSL